MLWLALGYSAFLQALSGFPNTTVRASPTALVNTVGNAMFSTPAELQNLAHLPLYGILGALWCAVFARRIAGPRALLLAALVACGLGLGNELSQLASLTRDFSPRDAVFNLTGAVGGVLACLAVARIRSRKRSAT